MKQKEIAELINVSPSTVCRELKRNETKTGRYNHVYAQVLANENIARSARNKKTPEWIKRLAIRRLSEEQWFPMQVSGWLKREKKIALSHETIYKWVREDKRQGGELYEQCRHKLKKRKLTIYGSRSNIPDRIVLPIFRQRIFSLDFYQSNTLDILSNCMCITEGFRGV